MVDVLEEFAEKDEAWEDLYSLYRHIFESNIHRFMDGTPVYYFERVEGAFKRPSFFIEYVSLRPDPYNQYLTWYDGAIQISFYSEDSMMANLIMAKLLKLFSPVKDVILPRYDFSAGYPEKISITGINEDARPVCSEMGARILPDTVTGRTFQEDDERWTTVIGLNIRSPRVEKFEGNELKHVKAERIGPKDTLPTLILEAGVSSTIEIQGSEE